MSRAHPDREVWDPDLGQRRCTADAKGKLRDGAEPGTPDARCGNRPPAGAYTCRFHGSATRQAKRAARLRLAELTDPAITTLARILATDTAEVVRDLDGTPIAVTDGPRWSDKRQAAEAILDRTGYPRRLEIDVEAGRRELLERVRELREEGG